MKRLTGFAIGCALVALALGGCAPKPEGDLSASPESAKPAEPAEKPADDKAAATESTGAQSAGGGKEKNADDSGKG